MSRYIVQIWARRLDYSHNASATAVHRVVADTPQHAAAKGCGRASVTFAPEMALVYADNKAAAFCGAFTYSNATSAVPDNSADIDSHYDDGGDRRGRMGEA